MLNTPIVILAGGRGSRIGEETHALPKPMIEIDGKPIIWHIMKGYAQYGYHNFIICTGYKGDMIKSYFYNYHLHHSNISIHLANNDVTFMDSVSEPWTVSIIDTGLDTLTGGRVKRIEPYIKSDTFMLTYGDGVGDIDIAALHTFHNSHGKLATVTSTQPSGRFGVLGIDAENNIHSFQEKPGHADAWINAGFFVLDKKVLSYIENDTTAIWEKHALETLAHNQELMAFKHRGFWKPMDTLKDKMDLEEMVEKNTAPWITWTS
jgi:glucose-1-phosphate cytidylyltransferase